MTPQRKLFDQITNALYTLKKLGFEVEVQLRMSPPNEIRVLKPHKFKYNTDYHIVTRKSARPNLILETFFKATHQCFK